MANDYTYDVFLSHSSKDKAVVWPLAERLRTDGRHLKAEVGFQPSAFSLQPLHRSLGSDWAQLEAGTCFNDFQIAQPPRPLLDQFSAIVASSFRLIYRLHLQIQNLRRTRDLLLPRLLSGDCTLKL